jgi:aminomethyltransferase
VQGTLSDEVLTALDLPVDHEYMSFADGKVAGHDLTVCRTGYTGERGYELIVSSEGALDVWDALIEAGEPRGIRACGLGARDTLRTEMGYRLHGHELSAEISPVMAGAGWAVGWDKPAFWGKEVLERQRAEKTVPTIRGLLAQGRGIPRPGMTVVSEADDALGEITSGTFSPTLRQGIGLALLDRSVEDGATVQVDVRGRREAFTVTKPPFVEPKTREA